MRLLGIATGVVLCVVTLCDNILYLMSWTKMSLSVAEFLKFQEQNEFYVGGLYYKVSSKP